MQDYAVQEMINGIQSGEEDYDLIKQLYSKTPVNRLKVHFILTQANELKSRFVS